MAQATTTVKNLSIYPSPTRRLRRVGTASAELIGSECDVELMDLSPLGPRDRLCNLRGNHPSWRAVSVRESPSWGTWFRRPRRSHSLAPRTPHGPGHQPRSARVPVPGGCRGRGSRPKVPGEVRKSIEPRLMGHGRSRPPVWRSEAHKKQSTEARPGSGPPPGGRRCPKGGSRSAWPPPVWISGPK